MKKNKLIKHSSMVVAALLAVAPVLSNNVAYAATTPAESTSKNTSTPGDSIDNPIKLTSKVTASSIKIKYKDGLTASDIAHYVVKNMIHEYADSSEIKYPSGGHSLYNSEGKSIYINKINQGAVHTGDTVKVHPTISSGLEPNTWYSWTSNQNPYDQFSEYSKDTGKREYNLPEEIKDRSSVVSIGKNQYKISVKTDDIGNLIRVRIRSANKVDYERDNAIEYSSPETVTATIVDPSDKDGIDIPLVTQTKPTNSKPSDTKNDKPTTDTESKPTTPDETEPTTTPSESSSSSNNGNSISNSGSESSNITVPTYTPSESEGVNTSKPAITPEKETKPNSDSNGDSEKPTQKQEEPDNKKSGKTTSASKVKKLMFTHNAFVYNSKGKLVKTKGSAYILLRKNKYTKVLDNGKIYTIKGKKFYRIGKNKYVKVANVGKRPKAKVINKKAKVKGNKKTRIYNSEGKATKKYAKKTIKLDRQRTINGKKYYRIAKTNNWVRASKVTIKK